MNNLFDLIIIGAGPAGLAAAIYAGRSKLHALVIEGDTPGGQISITSEVINYPGIYHTSGASISDTMKQQARGFGVRFLADSVVRLALDNEIKDVHTSSGNVHQALSVIIATGAKPRTLGFEGEKEFTGHGVAYCATCDGQFFTGMDIFVIGAGFAAAEEALFLTRYARKITIIAREPEFTCSRSIAEKVLRNERIDVRFNTELLAVTGDTLPRKARFINNITKEEWLFEVSQPEDSFGIFVFVGYEPISGLFKDKLNMDGFGYILTDENMMTNIEGVYAAGDVRPKRLRQLVTAVSDGAIAATSIERFVEAKKERLGITVSLPEAGADENDVFKHTGIRAGGQDAWQPDDVRTAQKEKGNSAELSDPAPVEPFIDSGIIEQLMPLLEKFERPVILSLIAPDNDESADEELTGKLRQVAKEFSELTDKITFMDSTEGASVNGISNYPALAILKDNGEFTGIAYYSVPGGHEFNSFVLALYNSAGPGQELDDGIIERINEIARPLDIKICVSLACTMCPDVVIAAQCIASKNPNVTAGMYDISHFPNLRRRYRIMSVPAMIINDEVVHFGKKNIAQVLDILVNFIETNT